MSKIKELTIIDRVKIFERDGKQWTTSLNIAEVFGKNHFDVLDKIEKLECSQEFRYRNFTVSSYITSQNKEQKMYDLSRDGFSFLVMGFTGTKAAQFKEAYIEAFNLAVSLTETQLSITDRYVLLQERIHSDYLDLQKRQQILLESMNGKVCVIDNRVEKVEDDVSVIKNDVADIKVEISNFKNVIPLTRRNVSKTDRRTHMLFVSDHFDGQCPICKTRITDASKNPTDTFSVDHAINRHERALNQTWAICRLCNLHKSSGKLGLSEKEINSLFDAYHTQLRIWQSKKPLQLQIGVSNG
jgi:Rha family phage regulatory protein